MCGTERYKIDKIMIFFRNFNGVGKNTCNSIIPLQLRSSPIFIEHVFQPKNKVKHDKTKQVFQEKENMARISALHVFAAHDKFPLTSA